MKEEDFKDVDAGKIDPATSGGTWPRGRSSRNFGEKLLKSDTSARLEWISKKNSEGRIYFCWIDQSWPRISEEILPGTGRIRPAATMFWRELSMNRQGLL